MASHQEQIDAVLDQIQEVKAAKIELHQRTKDLVEAMKIQGKSRHEGLEYMEQVCVLVDARTASWAMKFFESCWPEDSTDG